jgi:predicted nucleic acid-binding protein
VSFLVDSNVLSELRKRERANARVREWFTSVTDNELFLSVLTIGEIRRGIDSIQRRDQARALALNRWFHALVTQHQDRILVVDREVAEAWGRMNVAATLPVIDSLLAATAQVHGLTVATRNTKDLSRTGVPCLNPFAD